MKWALLSGWSFLIGNKLHKLISIGNSCSATFITSTSNLRLALLSIKVKGFNQIKTVKRWSGAFVRGICEKLKFIIDITHVRVQYFVWYTVTYVYLLEHESENHGLFIFWSCLDDAVRTHFIQQQHSGYLRLGPNFSDRFILILSQTTQA